MRRQIEPTSFFFLFFFFDKSNIAATSSGGGGAAAAASSAMIQTNKSVVLGLNMIFSQSRMIKCANIG